MWLPPADAVLASPEGNLTFGALRARRARALADGGGGGATPTSGALGGGAGCGLGAQATRAGGAARRLVASTPCDAAGGAHGVMCWLQCVDVSDLECGTAAECVDAATGEAVDGASHCPSSHANCALACPAAADDGESAGAGGARNNASGAARRRRVLRRRGRDDAHGRLHAVGEAGARPYCLSPLHREWTLDGRASSRSHASA